MRKLLLLLTICLSACATMNGDECRAGRHRQQGREGGVARLAPRTASRQLPPRRRGAGRSCLSHAYAQGLRLYCSESTGYREGYLGYAYFGVCTGEEERTFLKGMEAGLRARLAEGYGDCPGGMWRNPHAWCPHWFER